MAGFHDDIQAGLFTCCGLGPECPFQPCLLCLICSNSAPTILGTSSTAASSRAPASSLAPSLLLCTNLFLCSSFLVTYGSMFREDAMLVLGAVLHYVPSTKPHNSIQYALRTK